ncbi:hypothetical protein QE152_g39035 [Popillia japonica]|uniref:Uncharacterized protein n=1 Tax=Popillia japonica TaxID=7064 RepID=A0AAW1HV97_POPJA
MEKVRTGHFYRDFMNGLELLAGQTFYQKTWRRAPNAWIIANGFRLQCCHYQGDNETEIYYKNNLTRNLKVRNAVPSKLPGCPSYLSKPETSHRECPTAKRQRIECQNIQKVLAESIEMSEAYVTAKSFSTLDEAYKKILDVELNDKCWVPAKGVHNICIFISKKRHYLI